MTADTKIVIKNYSYGTAILAAFDYLLSNYSEVFVMGQGLWSPWYVGNSMTNLDKKFGTDRIIDTPVSEAACTGAALGASISGMKPIVVHPRLDFMLYAMDPIINQAAKWSHMFGGKVSANLTIRGIINRGGEQGAQHSQSLHAWFAHVPGLRVVMPSTVADARDLLIAAVLCKDPVLYIDDRWLYEEEDNLPPVKEINLTELAPKRLRIGDALTIVASGYSTKLSLLAADSLRANYSIDAEVIDLRVINPLNPELIIASVEKTGRLLVVDGSWKSCSLSSEIIATVLENTEPSILKCRPKRVTLPDSPAPTSKQLEAIYYPTSEQVAKAALDLLEQEK